MQQPGTDPFSAADNYKRACELANKAKVELIASAKRHRGEINVRGLARRAGLHESTLHHWIEKDEVSANGGQPAATG